MESYSLLSDVFTKFNNKRIDNDSSSGDLGSYNSNKLKEMWKEYKKELLPSINKFTSSEAGHELQNNKQSFNDDEYGSYFLYKKEPSSSNSNISIKNYDDKVRYKESFVSSFDGSDTYIIDCNQCFSHLNTCNKCKSLYINKNNNSNKLLIYLLIGILIILLIKR